MQRPFSLSGRPFAFVGPTSVRRRGRRAPRLPRQQGPRPVRPVPRADRAQGLMEGNAWQVVNQAVGALAAMAIAAIGTLVFLKILDAVMGLRVGQQDELQGLDVSQHGEEGYIFM